MQPRPLRSAAAAAAAANLSSPSSGSPSFLPASGSYTAGSAGLGARRPYQEDISSSRYHYFASGTHSSSFGAPATATSPDLAFGSRSFRPTFRKSSSQPQPAHHHHHHRSLSPPMLRGPSDFGGGGVGGGHHQLPQLPPSASSSSHHPHHPHHSHHFYRQNTVASLYGTSSASASVSAGLASGGGQRASAAAAAVFKKRHLPSIPAIGGLQHQQGFSASSGNLPLQVCLFFFGGGGSGLFVCLFKFNKFPIKVLKGLFIRLLSLIFLI